MEIIRASTSADLLALVPALVGFDPARSLVCVPFIGNRTLPTALRVDLPRRRREADARGLVNALLGMMSRFRGVDGVALVVYSDLTFEQERGVPYLDLARAAERGFERAGFRVVEAACVAPDGWHRYLDRVHRDVGRPLSEIDESAVGRRSRELCDIGRSGGAPEVPVADPAERDEVARLLASDSLEPLGGRDIIDVVEEALEADDVDAALAAGLLALLTRNPLRDVVLLQWVYGRGVGEDTFDHNMLWLAIQERTGEPMDAVVARELAEAKAAGLDAADLGVGDAELLIGRTTRIPDRDRLARALAVAQRLVAVAPDTALAPALTVLGWLSWALGRGTAAGELFDRALAADPRYGLARIMHAVVGAGMLPDWLFTVAADAAAAARAPQGAEVP